MSIPKKALQIYDEDNYIKNYKRKAYIDDNVLLKSGVNIYDVIIAFQLENKKFYKDFSSEVYDKNNFTNIKSLQDKKAEYKILTLNTVLNNYDFGYDKYNRLQVQEAQITFKYDHDKGHYKKYSYMTGGKLIGFNITYIDLIDDTYRTVKDVVKKIKQLEEKL